MSAMGGGFTRSNCVMMVCAVCAILGTTLSTPTHQVQTPQQQDRLQILPPIFMMSEQILTLQDKDKCLEKTACLVARDSINGEHMTPMAYISKYLANVDHDLDDETFTRIKGMVREYPRMQELLNASKLGRLSNGLNACNEVYRECDLSVDILKGTFENMGNKAVADWNQNETQQVQTHFDNNGNRQNNEQTVSRNRLFRRYITGYPHLLNREPMSHEEACRHTNRGCIGTSIGCAVCAVFSAGVCAPACASSAILFCGSAAIGCTK